MFRRASTTELEPRITSVDVRRIHMSRLKTVSAIAALAAASVAVLPRTGAGAGTDTQMPDWPCRDNVPGQVDKGFKKEFYIFGGYLVTEACWSGVYETSPTDPSTTTTTTTIEVSTSSPINTIPASSTTILALTHIDWPAPLDGLQDQTRYAPAVRLSPPTQIQPITTS